MIYLIFNLQGKNNRGAVFQSVREAETKPSYLRAGEKLNIMK